MLSKKLSKRKEFGSEISNENIVSRVSRFFSLSGNSMAKSKQTQFIQFCASHRLEKGEENKL